MARGLNKVMIIGFVGREPEMRFTPSGRPVTSFSVATSRSWTSADGERREETEWFNVVAWGNLAEICKTHLTKGQQVYVEGRLQTRGWEDETGKKHFRTELVANEMILLGERRTTHHELDYDSETGDHHDDDFTF
ncbi:MAG TPA: single-stranded DNA-binding protein [Aggregatilineales bacterium]|jgi:single-strand DNA-binding protein|nr:single-stranded DNA-binding protein [Aggregatilineales bacterium]